MPQNPGVSPLAASGTAPHPRPAASGRGLAAAFNVLLLLLLAWGLARLTWRLLPPGARPAGDAAAAPVALRHAHSGAASDARQIAALHLFGQTGRTGAAPIAAAGAPARLDLTLRGIVAADLASEALAIIQKPGAAERHFAIGQQVFGLATLEEIHVDHVVLLHRGRHEILRLPRESVAASAAGAPRATRPLGTNRERVQRMMALAQQHHARTLEQVRNPWQLVRWKPVMEAGKIVGLELAAEEEKAFLERHGLKLGDVITAINGHSLDGGGGLAQALDAMGNAKTLQFRVRRADGQTTVSVEASH